MEQLVYQNWKGSNKFFLGGRLVFGPDVKSLFFTLVLILGPAVVFCVFVAKDFLDRFNNNSGTAIMVVMVVFTIYILVLLLLTSGRDPGIVPRNSRPPEHDGETDFNTHEWVNGQWRYPRTKDVIVNGVAVKIKYCDTCMLYRPPRCSHCSICNNCVERFDHHCPWVGQCIGQRNYRFFFMFVSSSTILCIYVFAICALRIKFAMDDHHTTVWGAMRKAPAAVALLAYTFVAVWFVGGLTLFHLYLISTNQTTYENFRYRYDNKVNPYNLGMAENFRELFCSSIPPSKPKFRSPAPKDQSPSRSGHSPNPNLSPKSEMDKPAWPQHQEHLEQQQQQGATYDVIEIGRTSNGGDIRLDVKEGTFNVTPQDGTSVGLVASSQHPRRSSWGRKSGSWEITPDVMALGLASGVGAPEGGSGRSVNGAGTPPGNR